MRYLVMMPTYNEKEILRHSVTALLAELPEANLLIIDDNSPDGTGDIADELAAEHRQVSVLHRSSKSGLGAAYAAGVGWGLENGFSHLIQMDADGSHRPADLAKLLEQAVDFDLVIGSRWIPRGRIENWSKMRELISRFGNAYTRFWLGGAVRDMTAGFRIYSAELAKKLPFGSTSARGYGFQVEMTLQSAELGAKIIEVPITFVEREGGKSKMTLDIIIEAFWLTTKWGISRKIRR